MIHRLLLSGLIATAFTQAATANTDAGQKLTADAISQVVCLMTEQQQCRRAVGISTDRGFIWVGESLRPDAPLSKSIWAITDSIPYPPITAPQVFSDLMCRYHKQFDQSIMAVVKPGRGVWMRADKWAYRVNPEKGTLERIDPAAVDCYNDLPGTKPRPRHFTL